MEIKEFVEGVKKGVPEATLEQILAVWAFQHMKLVRREDFFYGMSFEGEQMNFIRKALRYYKESQ